MPTLEYFLVARSVVIDQFTNAVSVHSIVDEVSPRRFPAIFMRMTALVGFNAKPEEVGSPASYRVVVRLPGEMEMVESSFDFTIQWRRHRYVTPFIGLRVKQPGEILFTLFSGGQEIAHHSVLVHEGSPDVSPDGWLMYEPGSPG